MKLSIIILNYKNRNLVKYFLKNVLEFNFDFNWEVVVVDNDSGDNVSRLIKKDFPVVKFIQNKKNTGMGDGNNIGIENSSGEYVFIANPDITLNENAIKKLVAFLDAHKDAAIAAPQVLNPDKTLQDTCFHWPNFFTFLYRRTFLGSTKKGKKNLSKFIYRREDLVNETEVDWVLGGCFMVKRSALDVIGLFDNRFFLFLEDTDLCRRIWLHGMQVWYLPSAKIIHLPHRLSSGTGSIKDMFSRLTWVHLASWVKYFWKWRNK